MCLFPESTGGACDVADSRATESTPNPKARLQAQVHEAMRFFHSSRRTEETYWGWIVRCLRFHRKHSDPTPSLAPPAAGAVQEQRWRYAQDMGAGEVCAGWRLRVEGLQEACGGRLTGLPGQRFGRAAETPLSGQPSPQKRRRRRLPITHKSRTKTPVIPMGFRCQAQGCEERATVGQPSQRAPTPTGLCPLRGPDERNPVGVEAILRPFPG
jgi:hypothetical protein